MRVQVGVLERSQASQSQGKVEFTRLGGVEHTTGGDVKNGGVHGAKLDA